MGTEPDTASNAAPAAAESDSMLQGVVSASEEKEEEEEAEGGFSCGVTSRISGNAEFVSGGDGCGPCVLVVVAAACCVRKPRALCLAADGVDACSWDYDNDLIKGVVRSERAIGRGSFLARVLYVPWCNQQEHSTNAAAAVPPKNVLPVETINYRNRVVAR
jgi:hypothetical protein